MRWTEENGQRAAVLVNGIWVPSDSFIPTYGEPSGGYRIAESNSIPLSPRTYALLHAPIADLMAEKRGVRLAA